MTNPQSFVRWGGAAFMLGNALFLVNKLDEMARTFFDRQIPDPISGDNVVVVVLGQLLLVAGYLAFYRRYAPHVSRASRNALRLFSGGGITLAVGHVTFLSPLWDALSMSEDEIAFSPFLLVMIGLLVLLLGLIAFGVLTVRRSVIPRAPWLPLATGLVGFVCFVFYSGEVITGPFLILRSLFAVGLIGLGAILWLDAVPPAAEPG